MGIGGFLYSCSQYLLSMVIFVFYGNENYILTDIERINTDTLGLLFI